MRPGGALFHGTATLKSVYRRRVGSELDENGTRLKKIYVTTGVGLTDAICRNDQSIPDALLGEAVPPPRVSNNQAGCPSTIQVWDF